MIRRIILSCFFLFGISLFVRDYTYASFYEDFSGGFFNSSAWESNSNAGLVNFSTTHIQLLNNNSSNSFPYVRTVSPIFLTTGAFETRFSFRYLSSGNFGDGIALSNNPPPYGTILGPNHKDYILFLVWQDSPGGLRFYTTTCSSINPVCGNSLTQIFSYSGANFDNHSVKITYDDGGVYRVFLDTDVVPFYVSASNQPRPVGYWLGHSETTGTNDFWSPFEVDYIYVDDLLPTPTPTPTPTPPPSFFEEFNGSYTYPMFWESSMNAGTLNFTASHIQLLNSNSSYSFPYLRTTTPIFPEIGEFETSFSFKYFSTGNFGDGIALSGNPPPNGSVPEPNLSDYFLFSVWQDSPLGLRLHTTTCSFINPFCDNSNNIIYSFNGIDFNDHTVNISYDIHGVYRVYVDNRAEPIFMSAPGQLRPLGYWLGHPSVTFTNDFWSPFEVDYIHVNEIPIMNINTLGPANVWVGLKNSDDVGIRFDLRAEAYKEEQIIGEGELFSVRGGSSGFNNAKLNSIPLTLFSSVPVRSGDRLSIKLLVRNACSNSGKNSGTARLWYNDSVANSNFEATIDTMVNNYYLLNGFLLGLNPGTGPKTHIDVSAGSKCSTYKQFGVWNTIF